MALISNSICPAFIRDKYENIFIPHLLSSQPRQRNATQIVASQPEKKLTHIQNINDNSWDIRKLARIKAKPHMMNQ